jgi:uncharacterized membrane protein
VRGVKRWIAPIAAAVLIAAAIWQLTLVLVPMVLMEVAERRMAAIGNYNRFTHAPPVDARRQTIVRPSPDLLYSACPFELAEGPLEVTAWPIPGHYSSISVFSARSDVVFVRNDEQMAGQPIRIVIATHSQAVPPGVEVVRVTLPRGIVLQRVLIGDRSEVASVQPLRERAQCRTLMREARVAEITPRK